MRLPHIVAALYGKPLYITSAGFDAVDAIVRPYLTGKNKLTEVRSGDFEIGKTDIFGTPLPEVLEIDDDSGFATVNILGPLIQHASLIEKTCGATSYDDIATALMKCQRDRGVSDIFLNISSPGGQHQGCLEVANLIARIAARGEKQIIAFTDSEMCSAAYFLAAGCQVIFSTPSAYVGCIGSLIAFLDESKAYEMEGLKAVVLASGKYKGTGVEGTSLTPEQESYLMGLVTTAADSFKSHVTRFREVEPEIMEGQAFYGGEGEVAGLVDEIVFDRQEAVDALR